jgi:hypothetical protein
MAVSVKVQKEGEFSDSAWRSWSIPRLLQGEELQGDLYLKLDTEVE